MLDLKITGGTIVDGTGAPRYRGDVGIKDGRIVALGKVDAAAKQTIDATGKIVAPGFVDVHTHYDAQVFWDPTLSPSSFHGTTTIFGGFCGFSIAPLSKESGSYLMPMLARVEGMPLESLASGATWDWTSFADYLSRFEGTLAINAGFMAGHSAIRRFVMGPRAVGQRATREELDKMKELLRASIREGAMGFSTTLSDTHNDDAGNPVPSRAASREEVLELFSVISEFEGTSAEMIPGVNFNDEIYEILTATSLAAKRPVNWNSISLYGMKPEELKGVERKMASSDYAKERGATVIGLASVRMPAWRVNLASGMGFDTIPSWESFFKLPIPERVKKLRDPAYLETLKAGAQKMTGILARLTNWSKMKVAEVFASENKKYEGRMVEEIATTEGRDPFDVFVSIAAADDLRTSFRPEFPEDSIELYRERAKIWNDPRAVVGASDAGAHLDAIDTFTIPTSLLALGVRKHKVITLEQGVYHLTQKPAQLMGLKDRGNLKEGWHADVVIFDEDTVGPGEIYTRDDLPGNGVRLYSDATGIHHIIVNGREVIREGKYLGVPAGIILRPGKDTYTVEIPAAKKSA